MTAITNSTQVAIRTTPSVQARATNLLFRATAKQAGRVLCRLDPHARFGPLLARQLIAALALPQQCTPRNVRVTPARINEQLRGEWVCGGGDLDGSKVVLHFHGSGYFALSAASARPITWRLSAQAARPVLSIDYRLAPAHDLRESRADALAAYRWLMDQGYSASDITLAGDSAGGHLALALMLTLKQQQLPLPSAAVLLSAWTDMADNAPSRTDNSRSDALVAPGLANWLARCCSSNLDASDPLVSPVHGDYTAMPPMLFIASESELLRDDTRRVVTAARDVGVHVEHDEWPGQIHDFTLLANLLPDGREALARAGSFIRSCDSADRTAVGD